jgi:hypothetical protein
LLLDPALEIFSTRGIGRFREALFEVADLPQKLHFFRQMTGSLEKGVSQPQFFGPTEVLIQVEWLPGSGQTFVRVLRQPFLNFLFDCVAHGDGFTVRSCWQSGAGKTAVEGAGDYLSPLKPGTANREL